MDGLAIDPVSRLLFYTDTGYDEIVVITLDGNWSKTIVNQNLDQPRAIAVNPKTGSVYMASPLYVFISDSTINFVQVT